MKCPQCHKLETKVIDSRMNQTGEAIRRRRVCESCGFRYTTYERIEELLPAVIKKDGRREPFSREKIVSGITKAAQKRAVTTAQIEKTVDEVIRGVQELGEKEVDAQKIGYLVMNKLRLLDEVAYVRFSSVYRTFRDIDEFVQELQEQRDFPIEDPNTQPFPFEKRDPKRKEAAGSLKAGALKKNSSGK
jgi:transcriptional repressor NrdR